MSIVRPSTLFSMCKLYSEASIESDMGKRIMLSIIPAVQSETERYHTGGFDYKALRAAVGGAKDIIMYGARACVKEMRHAYIYAGDNDNEKEFEQKKGMQESIQTLQDEADRFLREKKYFSCLTKALELFKIKMAWRPDYGGPKWAQIAQILLDLSNKDIELSSLRQKASSSDRDDRIDYPAQEAAIMKEIVVLLNVFDGLAHNSSSIMYNIVEEEIKDHGMYMFNRHEGFRHDDQLKELIKKEKILQKLQDDEWEQNPKTNDKLRIVRDDIKYLKNKQHPHKYLEDVLKLMDAKELKDPFEVYRQVAKIVEQGENKHLFADYINRIKQDPRFAEQSKNPTVEQLKKIRLKKLFIPMYKQCETYLTELMNNKDQLVNISRTGDKEYETFSKLMMILSNIESNISSISYHFDYIRETIISQFKTKTSQDQVIDKMLAFITTTKSIATITLEATSILRAK